MMACNAIYLLLGDARLRGNDPLNASQTANEGTKFNFRLTFVQKWCTTLSTSSFEIFGSHNLFL